VLILTGLSVAVAFTVGLFNIGGEGQLIWGALAAAVTGRALDLPAPLLIPRRSSLRPPQARRGDSSPER